MFFLVICWDRDEVRFCDFLLSSKAKPLHEFYNYFGRPVPFTQFRCLHYAKISPISVFVLRGDLVVELVSRIFWDTLHKKSKGRKVTFFCDSYEFLNHWSNLFSARFGC